MLLTLDKGNTYSFFQIHFEYLKKDTLRVQTLDTRHEKLDVFTISVGNLTTGGTGKTPLTIYLAGIVHSIFPDKQVVVLSRGYRGNRSKSGMRVEINSDPADSGDEPLLPLGFP
jgi:tetraacyldisaccharide-1-P 4'-kinase